MTIESQALTTELLEALHVAGFVEKRIRNGITEWRITDKGRRVEPADLEAIDRLIESKGKQP